MSAEDEPRVWAKRDRAIVPPQPRLARAMRATPTEAERKLWWHLRHRVRIPGIISVAKFELAATSPILRVTQHASSSRSMEANTPDLQRMKNAGKFSKRTAIGCCDIGITTCSRTSM